MTRHLVARSAALLTCGLVALASCRAHRRQSVATVGHPWLSARAQQEIEQAERSLAFHDFRFTDRIEASGITFQNRIVDDAGKAYKHNHYDHGTGLCAADVDGDGLPDLYFVTQLGTNELWKNVGGGRFVNITDAAGLEMPDAVAAACAFADIDNDGLPDLFVTTVRHGNRLFRNLGGGKFRDITAQAGVGYVGHSSGAVFFDYDGDGLVDLFVTNVGVYTSNEKGPGGYYVGLADAFHGHTHPDRAEASILYHNLGGGRFKDVTREVGLVDRSWSGDATVIDVNDDGWPDLYILNMQGENHLWLNEGGKRFRDASREYFPKTPWGAMGVKAFDFDGDGRVDLLVTDMHDDMWVNIPPGDWAAETRKADSSQALADFFPDGKDQFIFGNALYANRGNGRFEEVSDTVGVETYWPWGPSVDDLNADGWDDIFIAAGMNFPALRDQLRAPKRSGATLPPQRIPARRRATPGGRDGASLVPTGLPGRRPTAALLRRVLPKRLGRPRLPLRRWRSPDYDRGAWHPQCSDPRLGRRRGLGHRNQRVQRAASDPDQ